ncbi:transcriptional regulator, XRE family [Lancefieldella parvula DSM 20469]|uniref:Transcriptional regulator, XRE family n=1 Tax=Lancefieldella parvula (strain ATCC 33793 / DSM 20469 / CCUG 32760 / JCM 10300 / KCTC 3663 / VPI 0546 / 1246) TaxID=521095 RepID=C8W874_LANP1|nr:helix-turn-helix domain-containing protein [Lancefieldella parvula]ACV51664.1 transcriptional regulator, XRE family [Lancefieldella parvula DSM 20469]
MTTSSETLGRRIARLRLAKTATQERLAKELNVSPQAVSKWESDINYPDISLLPDLARFLGVSVDELLSGASAFAQESVAAQEGTAEVVSVAADEPAEIVEEPTEQDNQGIATQSSGFSFGKLFGKSMVKVEKNDEADGSKKKDVRLGNGSAKHGLHVYVVSNNGDVVDMCVPLGLAKFVLNSGIHISGSYLNQETQKQLSNINFDALMEAAKTGESGTLVDITSADGNVVKIWFD